MVRQEFEFYPSQVKFVSPDGQTIKGLQLDDNGALSVSILNYQQISASDTSTTSSGSFVVINSMTITPAAGTWMVMFSTSGSGNQQNANMDIAIYKNGTIVADTLRKQGYFSSQANADTKRNIYTQSIVTTNGSEAIDVRYKVSAGTFTIHERNLILVRVG